MGTLRDKVSDKLRRGVIVLIAVCFLRVDGLSISSVSPAYGSRGGGTKLTIYGSGFSGDQYTQNDDPNKGNRVYMIGVDSQQQKSCSIHIDGCTRTQVQCYTPNGLNEEDYRLSVTVDGTDISDSNICGGDPTDSNCVFRPRMANSPTIAGLTPNSAKPYSVINMTGTTITDRYGTNIAASSNGKEQKLLRAYVGGKECELKSGDEFYGLKVGEDNDEGCIACKTSGSSVGYMNVSYMIEPPYGRSWVAPSVYKVSANDVIYMLAAYTNITSTSQSTGSKAGGLSLRVNGNYFDQGNTYTDAQAWIDDTICSVTHVEPNAYLDCTVSADPGYTKTQFRGNRGLTYESWTGITKSASTMGDILVLTSSDTGYSSTVIDETYHADAETNYVSRLTMFFDPPHTGSYQFFLYGDDGAGLYLDNGQDPIVTSSGTWESSARMNLEKDTLYGLQVVHYQGDDDEAKVHLKAKFYKTHFLASQLGGEPNGKANQEKQIIQIRADTVYEVQNLTFINFNPQTATNEVQQVVVDTDGPFRLGWQGVYTEVFPNDVDGPTVNAAFNKLPCFNSGESATVTRETESTPTFTFSFVSPRGPLMDVEAVGSGVTVTVTRPTPGVSNMDTMALMAGPRVSKSFSLSGLTAATLQDIADDMLQAKCPEVFESPATKKIYLDYESNTGNFGGTIVKDTEPFCGRYSLKNPWNIYSASDDDTTNILLSMHPVVCFAYKGNLSDSITLTFSFKNSTNHEFQWTRSYSQTFSQSSAQSSRWYYTCHDMMTSVSSSVPADSKALYVKKIQVHKSSAEDIYIDALHIGSTKTVTDSSIHLRRLPPLMHMGITMDKVTVAGASGRFAVEIQPFECANRFDLFKLAAGVVRSGTSGSSSNAISFAMSTTGLERMNVNRFTRANPPTTGTVDITFNGNVKQNLDATLNAEDFADELQSLDGIGFVSVEKTDGCTNFDYKVTLDTLPGDQPLMTVSGSNLVGINPTGTVAEDTDGGLFYDPLLGDMLSTIHDKPQVRVSINDIPTSCVGDCTFEWSASVTPSVIGVSPNSGTSALSTSITITGTGFDSSPSNNAVTIGGVACTVTASSSTSITCDVGNGPVGDHKVVVTVKDKGDADHSGSDAMFTYTAGVSGINPTSGSLGGGLLVTLSGYGFSSDASVTINSNPCAVGMVESTQLTCTVPASTTEGSFSVVAVVGSQTLTGPSFTYAESLTSRVGSVTPSKIPVTGSTITVTGSNFGNTQGTVMLGSTSLTVTSWSDAEVVMDTGALDAGYNQELKIDPGNGHAVETGSNKPPEVQVDLKVTNAYPLKGSLLGGTILTLTGSGFGTAEAAVSVKVGDADCEVTTISNIKIECKVGYAGSTHYVTNSATGPYGDNYAFDQPNLRAKEGDIVQWTWTYGDHVSGVTSGIYQIPTVSSKTNMEGGFTSGDQSKTGTYQQQFNKAGTYYVWSGYVDGGRKNYAGTVQVEEAVSRSSPLKVEVSGKEAVYDVGGSQDPTDGSSCQALLNTKDGCSDSQPTGKDSTKFNFAYYSCSTPKITSVDRSNGTTQTTLTLTGEGFSTADCQNEVAIGDATCTVTSSTATSITCQVAKTGKPDIGVLHEVSVRVGNRGTALVNIMTQEARSYALIPNIESITPESGSRAGGALLTISGFGLSSSPFVSVDGYQCPITSSSYSEIVCQTPSAAVDQTMVDVSATVNIGGSPYPVSCETSSRTCRYAYRTSLTSSVESITPNTMSGSLSFTIAGGKMGTNTAEVAVTIGGEQATITSVSDTELTGTIGNLPVGSNDVFVTVKDYGRASGALTVTSNAAVSSVTPSSGSIHGETSLTIAGNGFKTGDTSVAIDGSVCNVQSVSLAEVVCITSAHAAGSVNVAVTSDSVSFPTQPFSYDTGSTPTILSVSPTQDLAGQPLTITGTNLKGSSGATTTVMLDDAPCVVTSNTPTQIVCTLGNHETGSVSVNVHVSDLGASNTDVNFEYELDLATVNPQTGGIGGGQTLTLSGSGFVDSAVATVCSQTCERVSYTTTSYVCKTPANSAKTCNVEITANGLTKTLSTVYTYDSSLAATVTGVTPPRGGTGGGTSLTVSGSGFGNSASDVSVVIAGSACQVQSVTETQIECMTTAHSGSIATKVQVEVNGNGIAPEDTDGDANFQYVDVWSSPYTWGEASAPAAGDFVVIPKGQTILLDTDTPILKFLLIQGGSLIFDEKDVELQSEIIMITDGGLLQVGTEAQPFQHKGIITLHGHHRSKELPIYGTKVLAVRNGTLDLHGIEMPLTWTNLASTAPQGSNTLALSAPVSWNVGDEIVIASTGTRHSQGENEKKTISAISPDKMTLTLDSSLAAEHLGTSETFDGTLVEFRGEVGLLTHNVVVRGNTDPQWEDEIEACPAGFDTGEFVTQTCFQGRFGDEIGSSQFGAMILVHAPAKDTQEAIARLSYVEVTFAGQAYRLGRYPIHFHLNGEMSQSYVRGCGIHHTFNRAVNIHGSHNTMVEKTVIYNIMGGAFFLEDGIETGNTFQYNLAVFVKSSTSLLNDDVTPAAFWVTNPKNIIRHNAAAGGTHFGYWYRMHDHPDGPSFTPDVCPKQIPLVEFYNNSAHSFGWFGLWIFPDYFPKADECNGGADVPARFSKLFSWNNEKGIECVNCGSIQFEDGVLINNEKAGVETKKIMNTNELFTDNGPMVKSSLIIAWAAALPFQGGTNGGIIFGYGYGMQVVNTRFINFDKNGSAAFDWALIDGTCRWECGGYTYHTSGVGFVNSPHRINFLWEWVGNVVDKDGTLTDKSAANWKVLPFSESLPTACEDAPFTATGLPVKICPPEYNFRRYSFNNVLPFALHGKNVTFRNSFGKSKTPFRKKAISHPFGYRLIFVEGETYKFEFENAEDQTNVSLSATLYEMGASDYIMIKQKAKQFPDKVSFDGGQTFIEATDGALDPSSARHGDWSWDPTSNEMTWFVSGSPRSKRDTSHSSTTVNLNFQFFKCYYQDCIPPPDPDTQIPGDRPADYMLWHDSGLWNDTGDGYITNDPLKGSSYSGPQADDSVRVLYQSWIVINTVNINRLDKLLLEGVLELMDTPGHNYALNANYIIIRGGRLVVGTPANPFQASASITLRGDHSSGPWDEGEVGPNIGSKVIGVFGGLDLHGKDKGLTWTKLAATAQAGANQIVVADAVGWEVGDDIVLGPTTYNVWETESFRITAISTDMKTLTLNSTLAYRHDSYSETINGRDISLGAAVGLLSHNIKVIGEDYSDMYSQSFGARILVGLVLYKGQTYTGYARLSNVEFYHTGQEGYIEPYDPRFSIAYVATGTVSEVKPSNISKCSFHNGFNTAIGAFGIGGLNITDNVVFGSVGHAIRTSSDDSILRRNLVALVQWRGSYQDRHEKYNFYNDAGVEAAEAVHLILQENLVTGSERFGFHIPPQACDDTSDNYNNNWAQGNIIGVGNLPEDFGADESCNKYQNFITWRNMDMGIYYNGPGSFVAENNVNVDEVNAIHTHVFKPNPLTHVPSGKSSTIKGGTIVGTTPTFDCTTDTITETTNTQLRLTGTFRTENNGRIGVLFTSFEGADNAAPTKPFANIMAYSAIDGLTKVEDMTFAHFNPSSCGGAYAIATSDRNDDGQHPVHVKGITQVNVTEGHKVWFNKPNVGKVNSADCVDMDCDGLKKCMIKDLDGSLLGSIGSVIPNSAYEWDGDRRHGLGDYRIPKSMLTTPDGSRIAYEVLAPHKGIIRSSNCPWIPDWNAFKCMDYNYEMLIIENMDPDTETRRLSPVAILGEGYIDLINGPQDHGWCSGYTCRKRISTFMALVATGKDYLMHFTSTTPEHLRYYLQNSAADSAIKLTVWYSRPNRLDVFVDDNFVVATNGRQNGDDYYLDRPDGGWRNILRSPESKAQGTNDIVSVSTDPSGTNYYNRDLGELSCILKGPQRLDVKSVPTIIVSFNMPALTVEQFYAGENLVANIAAFFDIPTSKIRIVNVVSASSSARRRRRSASGVDVTVEIADAPTATASGTATNPLTQDDIASISSNVMNECQAGNLSASIHISGSCSSITVPAANASGEEVTYTTHTVNRLLFHHHAMPHYEGRTLQVQPKLHGVDILDNFVTGLGTVENPWQLSVSIRSGTGHPDATLTGTKVITAVNGWFNFTDLAISHMGTGYILDFNVIYPEVAVNFMMESSAFDVAGRPVKMNVKWETDGNRLKDTSFGITLNLLDESTDEVIQDVAWRSHTWSVAARILGTSRYGGLAGTLSSTFDSLSGEARFTDLTMTGVGIYYIQYHVVSNPPDYNFTLNQKIVLRRAKHNGMVAEKRQELRLKFLVDYNQVLPDDDSKAEFIQMITEDIADKYSNVLLEDGSTSEGSIVVTFVIAGDTLDVTSTAYSMCDSIHNGTGYSFNGYTLTYAPFLTVDNETYYGVTCGAVIDDEDDGKLSTGAIIGIAIGSAILLLLIVVIAILLWKFKVQAKSKTHNTSGQYLSHSMGSHLFFAENSYLAMEGSKGLPPPSTLLIAGGPPERRPASGMSGISVHVTGPGSTPSRGVLSPPSYVDSQATYIDPNDKQGMKQYMRSHSPAPSSNSVNGRVTPLEDRDSPLPPVGHDLYNTDYLLRPVPQNTTPHQPALSDKPRWK